MDDDKTAPFAPMHPSGLHPRGRCITGRFKIEELIGRGGMGCVYRAIDTSSGQTVALKLLEGSSSPESVYRFNREAALLAELHHPAIVAYVARGTTEAGQPYLAMEWLEGEDLSRRLARQPLRPSETLSLLRRAAQGLAAAHRQGIVHRDLKPSNLFLRGGRPDDVVLLDFGLARYVVPTLTGLTGSHTVLGTPGYMAPEQASSQPEIPPASDIFSLGCVLYECLTGKPPFEAPHFAAALAKILFAEPAPLHSVCPGLPAGLQVLVDRMLAKEPKKRIPDASGLLEALSALEPVPESPLPRAGMEPRLDSLAGAEQKLVSVLLASFGVEMSDAETVDWEQGVVLRDSLRTALSPHGARVELLANGSLVATLLPERGTATDLAALAARCALSFKERWPGAAVVLSTGLSVVNERFPVGKVMDRAGRLLRQLERLPTSSSSVVLDEVTAGLLGPGFQLARVDSGAFLLRGEQLGADASRPLLGKPTPCVGREQELALLEFSLNACIEEPAARALLVTAPAGAGKSRLRHEFLRRLERREQPPLLLQGRGDPMNVGASYGLLGQALRQLCGVVEGENLEMRRTQLYRRVALHLPEAEAQEVVEFLGELCAIPFAEEHSARLRAARGDPRLMITQVGRALVAFLRAECAHQPVLLVLEDVHWSDALSTRLVDEVLRELAGQPLMVLALARPEVKELFPGLWSRRLQQVPLNGLSPKASARLVREVLASQVPESVVQKVVEQADGNALFLEELIRRVAEGGGEGAPETVLAVLQSRLTRMVAGTKQVLLAASFFGRTFWRGGVRALLGGQGDGEGLDHQLRQLVEQELIEPRPDGHFSTEVEYRFRHALMRDAAYGLVPDSHRPVGHRLAGEWLEQVGEPDALVLATHYQLGQQLERAAHSYTRAAERLLMQGDLQGTPRCVQMALACEASGEILSRLHALQAVVAFWMEHLPRVLEVGLPALSGLKAGSPLWCRLMGGLLVASGYGGFQEELIRLREVLLCTSPEREGLAAYFEALAFLGATVNWSGDRQLMERVLARSTELGPGVMAHEDELARGWMCCLKSQLLIHYEACPWQAFVLAEQGARAFREIGAEQNLVMIRNLSGQALMALGELPGTQVLLRENLTAALRSGQGLTASYSRQLLMQALATSSEPSHWQQAHELMLEWMGSDSHDSYKRSMSHVILAQLCAVRGDLHEAEQYARTACELLVPFRFLLISARTFFSTILRARGHITEARRVATLGVGGLEQAGSLGVYAVASYLALAEACFADGDAGSGEEVLRKALRCVRARASDIPEDAARERFLCQVPENARTLELARQRWGDAAV